MKQTFAKLIVERLMRDLPKFQSQFNDSSSRLPCRFVAIDNLLPQNVAEEISHNFPEAKQMRLLSSFRERKYTSKNLEQFHPILREITFAVQDPEVISVVEKLTGMKDQLPDSKLYAGGLSLMAKDHYLHPHIDNSHESTRSYYRTLNLLYYVSPNWKEEYGGNLELWDTEVRNRVTIPSLFNRLVIMETNRTSWHSVSQVLTDQPRVCVSNYYFSPLSPDGKEYFHITSFSAPPEMPIRRAIAKIDNTFRSTVRLLVRSGLSKKDFYEGKPAGQ